MRNHTQLINPLLAPAITALTLGVLAVLRQWGGIEAEIESGWLRTGGVLASFLAIYECLRRTVFGRSKNERE